MIVSIVNGSPRQAGATGKVLRAAREYLEKKTDVQINYFDLGKYAFEFCQGCAQCYRTARCIIQSDGLEEVADAIKNSDGIIMGSPTYGSNLTPQMKNFMDRGHFIVEQSLQKKYGMSVSTYEIADGHQVNRLLNKFFLVSGASRITSLCIKTEHNTDPFTRLQTRRLLESKVERFYLAVLNHRPKSLFETCFTDQLLVNMIWKPFVLKHREKYAGVIKQWERKKLFSGGVKP